MSEFDDVFEKSQDEEEDSATMKTLKQVHLALPRRNGVSVLFSLVILIAFFYFN